MYNFSPFDVYYLSSLRRLPNEVIEQYLENIMYFYFISDGYCNSPWGSTPKEFISELKIFVTLDIIKERNPIKKEFSFHYNKNNETTTDDILLSYTVPALDGSRNFKFHVPLLTYDCHNNVDVDDYFSVVPRDKLNIFSKNNVRKYFAEKGYTECPYQKKEEKNYRLPPDNKIWIIGLLNNIYDKGKTLAECWETSADFYNFSLEKNLSGIFAPVYYGLFEPQKDGCHYGDVNFTMDIYSKFKEWKYK